MSLEKTLVQAIIERTLVVPRCGMVTSEAETKSEEVSRQLDIALISAGFKADPGLLIYIAALAKVDAVALAQETVTAVKSLVGDHVKHNTYFRDFPDNVPDTVQFWAKLVEDTFGEDGAVFWNGNLLELNGYGTYLHTYEEMLESHKPFTEKMKRQLKSVHLGNTLQTEADKLFISLAESSVPLNEGDRELLGRLAHITQRTPKSIPVRENKAIINVSYIEEGRTVIADTVADILRLAAHLSGGDVTLNKSTHYKTFTNRQRKALLRALHNLPDNKLVDVLYYPEQIKRLVRHLHGAKDPKIRYLLDIANRKTDHQTIESHIEAYLEKGDVQMALVELDKVPGKLLRYLNRLLMASRLKDFEAVNKSVEKAIEKSSLRVILSLRQYLENRNTEKIGRAFVNTTGGTYVLQESLPGLPLVFLNQLKSTLDIEVEKRMKDTQIQVDPTIQHYALPISDKQRATGLSVVPRGTKTGLDPDAEVLRLFTYWKEKSHADYDLSVILLDESFQFIEQVSYTRLRGDAIVHSGDLTSAPSGASEFIDIELKNLNEQTKYLVPQVNVYSGDTFDEAKEAFFGFMLRSLDEKGKPFEAKTVETKSDLYGTNRIALPLIVAKEEDGWFVKQLNLFLKGNPRFNATETNASQTQVLIQSVVADTYLTMEYLAEKVELKEPAIADNKESTDPDPVKKITHTNLHEIIVE